MVQLVTKDYREQLRNVWLQCYDDPEDYVDFFFDNGFEKCRCAAAIEDGKTVGAIYLFDCSVLPSGKGGLYWYAGGVLPDYRGRGIYRQITDFVTELAEAENKYSFCFPAPGLDGFYKNLGLTDEYYCRQYTFIRKDNSSATKFTRNHISARELSDMRSGYAVAVGSVVWDVNVLEYVLAENEYCGGFCDRLKICGTEYFIIGQKKGDTLCVFETDIPLNIINGISNCLMASCGALRMNVSYPEETVPDKGTKRVMTALGNGGYNNADKWFVLTML